MKDCLELARGLLAGEESSAPPANVLQSLAGHTGGKRIGRGETASSGVTRGVPEVRAPE